MAMMRAMSPLWHGKAWMVLLVILLTCLSEDCHSFQPIPLGSVARSYPTISTTSTQLFQSIQDKILQALGLQSPPTVDSSSSVGTVTRLACRKYNATSSRPSSRQYTTRKDPQTTMQITKDGAVGDYNYYRTRALKSTENRTISILTTDVAKAVKQKYSTFQDGDLGENISVDGVSFRFFQVGKQYAFTTFSNPVVLEIMEPMEPCANLCKLSYINHESMSPTERIQRCQDFISYLGNEDGFRGWYAKVIQEGEIQSGDQIQLHSESKT